MDQKFDTIVIGFGKAGKTLAAKLAKQGEKVALIEKDARMYGGTCINVGCIPSKRLVMEAELAPAHDFEAQSEYYHVAVQEKKKLTAALRMANYNKLIDAGVQVINGTASFLDGKTIEVKGAHDTVQILSASKFIINTGARPMIPAVPGVENNRFVFTSETMMDNETLPRRLTIIGGGYIGLEFASMYARFGSKVTILQHGSVFLPKEDRDIAEAVENVLKSYGVSVLMGADLKEIREGTAVYMKNGEEDTLDGDAILLATGRRPNTEGLHAQRAGVELTKRGAVVTDKHLRTTTENIWAAGDVCGNLQFTYISLDDSRIILSDVQGDGRRTTENRGAFAYSVFMEPSFSRVGLSEKEAADKGLNYRVVRMNTDMIPKAKVLRKTTGMLKAVIDKDSGKILGAALFCPESYEIINMVKLAMDHDLDYTVLRDFIYTHPTMSEGLNDLFAL
ncbi:FAD-dependent oxidoreductase [Dialister invisus]|uniref:FAD-dependent oxidoreductase n=1 Tax=Dialister invisus TaxID=218538 RepID=UPI0028D03ED9|nr:FAD-dependent oxidoreductase [Dialister invisus]